MKFLALAVVAFFGLSQAHYDAFSGNGHSYRIYSGSDATSNNNAREKCKHTGGYLADVDDINEFLLIVNKMKTKAPKVANAYVDSWQGDNYGKSCIAFYQGGAIATPPEKCKGPLAFICEYNVPNKN